MRFNSVEKWLKWQEGLHTQGIELGLERCSKVAHDMGLLSPKFITVSVAGTNGKGSSVEIIEAILKNSVYKIGCYTSPHLIAYNERIRINGVQVTDQMLCESFNNIDNARKNISLTYFEFGTLAALDIFHRAGINIALFEVGLGGRLDAINCINANISLITSIDLDHTEWLGKDRESIAYEKAGIFRENQYAVCSDLNPPMALFKHAKKVGATLHTIGKDFHYQLLQDNWLWRCNDIEYRNLPWPSQYNMCQVQNAAGALMVLYLLNEQINIDIALIKKGLQSFNISARFQMIEQERRIILDVAHNIQAAENLMNNLKRLSGQGKIHLIIGMLKDKDHTGFLSKLINITDYWYTLTISTPRGIKNSVLKKKLLDLGVTVPISEHVSIADAFSQVETNFQLNDNIVVTGSFISVGEAMKYLQCVK